MKYYILNLKNNNSIQLEDLDELILWFSYYNGSCWYDKNSNLKLDNINMNFKDVTVIRNWKGKKEVYLREIMVFDEFDRIVDPRLYRKEILNTTYSYKKYKKRRKVNKNKYLYVINQYVYRKTPVPYTKKIRVDFSTRPSYIQERKINLDDDHKDYIRPKRKHINEIAEWYDYPQKHTDKSWKTNSKVRKQWMKNLR